jgi:hypothetical protein
VAATAAVPPLLLVLVLALPVLLGRVLVGLPQTAALLPLPPPSCSG